MGRICIIRQSIYPYDLLVRREAETLRQAGYETHVICLDRPDDENDRQLEEVINHVYVHRLPLRRKKTSNARYIFDYLSFAILACIKVTKLHLKRRFDVIQVNNMPDLLVFAAIVPKILGAKVVSMMYEPTPELWEDLRKSRPPFLLELVEQRSLAFADLTFTVTQQLKDAYVARGAKPEKIKVVLNAPDESFLERGAIDPSSSDKDGCFGIICHGAIEERYGQDTILEAIALVKDQIPSLRVRILGKGTYVEQMLERRNQLGLEDSVDYLGYVPLEQMIHELQIADIGIVAQKSSPYSNLVHTGKMYEYIAFGKAVLASRLNAVEAYFGRDALAYFEPGDPRSLAEGILDLFQHPERRQFLARNAQALYSLYSWEKQKEIYLSVYKNYLN
jgi:glycosyltransferase involved in cell wall biosynthesis